MTKLNPHETYDDAYVKHLQIVFLANCEKLIPKKIAEITGYAVSTVKSYIKKFADLLDEAIKLFHNVKDVIKEVRTEYKNGRGEFCYLFKFYDTDNEIIFSKIGTTTRPPRARLNEEIRSYKKSGFNIGRAVIESVIDCESVPAEGAESFTRAKFIRQYPNTFMKNDRFIGVDIPTNDFNNLVNAYLA